MAQKPRFAVNHLYSRCRKLEATGVAKSVVVRVTCDVCGAELPEDTETRFSFDSLSYSIDLCAADRQAMATSLAPYIAAARSKTGTKNPVRLPTVARKPARRDPEQVDAIREWAREHGYKVSDRGRIPNEIEEAYNKRS